MLLCRHQPQADTLAVWFFQLPNVTVGGHAEVNNFVTLTDY